MKTEAAPELTARQIDAALLEYQDAEGKIQDLRSTASEYATRLKQFEAKESNARKLLALTEGCQGFGNERAMAEDIIEHLPRQIERLNNLIAGCNARIKQQEEVLRGIDKTALEKAAQIRKIVADLK